MKKNVIGFLSLVCSTSLWTGATPSFVQVPSSFSFQSIATNTSRYFFKTIRFAYAGNEQYIFSLQNTGSRVARISAIGGASYTSLAAQFFNIHLYKNGTISGTNYGAISNSTLEISTDGNFISGADEVYALQAMGDVGRVRGFEYIPKELYSVVIAPGETLTATLDARGSAGYDVIIMWEEIIN